MEFPKRWKKRSAYLPYYAKQRAKANWKKALYLALSKPSVRQRLTRRKRARRLSYIKKSAYRLNQVKYRPGGSGYKRTKAKWYSRFK